MYANQWIFTCTCRTFAASVPFAYTHHFKWLEVLLSKEKYADPRETRAQQTSTTNQLLTSVDPRRPDDMPQANDSLKVGSRTTNEVATHDHNSTRMPKMQVKDVALGSHVRDGACASIYVSALFCCLVTAETLTQSWVSNRKQARPMSVLAR